jgi:hypothetical protein
VSFNKSFILQPSFNISSIMYSSVKRLIVWHL